VIFIGFFCAIPIAVEEGTTMSKKVVWLTVLLLLIAGGFAEAQQPTKVPRIGYVSGSGNDNILDLMSKHSGDCEISVISRGKTSWLSIATLNESWTGLQIS
jgi:hypothetical protein